MGSVNDIIDAIRTDLAVIVDQARWAHVHGYAKAGHGLTAEHGTDLARTEDERAKGPTYDLQIGNHNARVAYQHACRSVARADLLLARALLDDSVSLQRPVWRLYQHSHPAVLAKASEGLLWRLDRIDAEAHAKTLSVIRRSFDRVVRGLSKALDAGPADGIAHNETPCKTCKIRPRAEREKPDGGTRVAAAGECDTCATWRRRNGTPRPTQLDTGPVNEARAAQARRMARGEGWGAA